jgi:uncharacterized protein YfaS (alpha-2-macroglobulin family)
MQNTIVAVVLTLLAVACGGANERDVLHVTGYAPSDSIDDPKAAIRISFDKAVVPGSDVGKTIADPPVNISPSVPLRAHWLDRQTLVLKPLRPLSHATRYSVDLRGWLAERLSETFSFSFVHDPLDIQGMRGAEPEWLSPQGSFTLAFDQAVRARAVVEHCKLVSKEGEAVALETKDPALTATAIAVTAAKKLSQGARYDLRCAEVPPAQGNAALLKPYEAELRVVPQLTLVKSTPEDRGRVTPDELTVSLTFSSPVDVEKIVEHLHLEPRHRSFKSNFVQRGATEVEVTLTLEAATQYALKIDAALTDRFGQKLKNAQTIRFGTTDAAPSVSLERGIYAIEAMSEGYPVWSRNVPRLDLHCAQVPTKRIVQTLTSNLNYQPWYQEGSKDELSWKTLGLKSRHIVLKPESAKNKWSQTRVDLPTACGTGQRGLYLAEVRSPLVEQQKKQRQGVYLFRVLGNVTDLGVLLKIGPASGLVWVANLSSAAPVEGALVSVYAPDGKRVWNGTTDARGLATTPGSSSLLPRAVVSDPYEGDDVYRDQRLIAIVETADDVAVVDGNWQDGIEAWNFGYDVDRSGSEHKLRGFLESDRGIYRPGETVHIKGIAREISLQGQARVPTQRDIAIKVEDSQGGTILDERRSLSEFGGFHFDVALSTQAATGDYYVTATLGGQSFRQNFSVEEIKPVTFEVDASRVARDMALGESARIDLTARYLFGAPVSMAKVTYQVERRPKYLSFSGYEQYSFADWSDINWDPWWEADRYASFVSEGSTETDASGHFSFSFKEEDRSINQPQDYLVRATVRDSTDQEVTKTVAVAAHPTSFYLGIQPQSWVQKAEVPFAVQVVAVRSDGTPLATDAELVIERVRWECGAADSPYGYASCERRRSGLDKRKVKISAGGALTEQLTAKGPGEFVVRVEAKDAKGRAVRASSSVWVVGAGESSWAQNAGARVNLIASKKSYMPGDVAVLVPQASTEGATMLVTVERNGVLDTRIERSNGASTGFSIPIRAEHAPNVYVSVAILRGRRGERDADRPDLKFGIASLPVTFEAQRLKVELILDRTDFEPGQQVAGRLRVTQRDGTPVRAEVALSAADEGVLQLIAYQTPDPLDSMYAPWGLGVETSANWNRILRQHNAPAETDEEEGSDSGGARPDAVRTRFVASAYWNPSIVTDARGEAAFAFKAPDNLTAFRLMAAAADVGMRFGSAQARIRVRKDLTILPILPRFLTVGDAIEVGAVVHNYTKQSGTAEVKIEVEGAEPRQTIEKVKIASNGEAVIRMPVTVGSRSGALRFHASARMGGVHDALEKLIPIEQPSSKVVDTLLDGREAKQQSVALSWSGALDGSRSGVEVTIDRTGLASLAPGLRYLIRYPYGCLEQTMSALVPLLKVRDLARSLSLPELQGEKLDKYITLGVAKVIRHQHPDGHFSLWPGSNSYPHLTVYALWGLNEAQRAGVVVEKRATALAVDAVRGWVHDGNRTFAPGDETATMAMAAFVLADLGQGDAGLNARLFAARAALPVYGKAFLLRAMARAKAPPADVAELRAELEASIDTSKPAAVVHEALGADSYYWSSDARSTAMVLSAFIEQVPHSPLVPALVTGLRSLRSESRWPSTQDNMYALVALSDYARSQTAGQAEVTIRLADQIIGKGTLKGGSVLRVHVPLGELPRGGTLLVEASEPVHALATFTRVTPELKADAAAHGFVVQREYLDIETDQRILTAKVGDLVKVRVRITNAQRGRYVAVSDPLPSGFEPLNTKLATERDTQNGESLWIQWDHRSLRDERTDWFIDDLAQGEHTLEYVMRATHAGAFTAAPSHAEEMYTPYVMGHAASAVLTVTR